MKKLILVVFLLFLKFSLACEVFPIKFLIDDKNKKVYFAKNEKTTEVEGIDFETFEIYDKSTFYTYGTLAKDKNNVYWMGKKVDFLEPDDVEVTDAKFFPSCEVNISVKYSKNKEYTFKYGNQKTIISEIMIEHVKNIFEKQVEQILEKLKKF